MNSLEIKGMMGKCEKGAWAAGPPVIWDRNLVIDFTIVNPLLEYPLLLDSKESVTNILCTSINGCNFNQTLGFGFTYIGQ